jgi:hypothetical protein
MTLRSISLSLLIFLIVLFLSPFPLLSWGFWAHKEITKTAIESLPNGLREFFRAHADSLIAKSTEPDQRRFADQAEPSRHYINIDRYGTYPFAELPRQYNEAVSKFGKGMVDSSGTLPWRIAEITEKLAESFRRHDVKEVVFYATWLGHYVADAHVPLHAAQNYDGQLTGQKGLHSRWESRIPEKFGELYRLEPRPASYLKDPLETAFEVVLESFLKVDSVLSFDKEALESIPEKERFIARKRGDRVIYEYSDPYYERYNTLLDGMVERRMNDAAQRIASYWLTAWENAGKPDLR